MKKAAANTRSANRLHKAIVALSTLINHALQYPALLPYMLPYTAMLLSVAFLAGLLR